MLTSNKFHRMDNIKKVFENKNFRRTLFVNFALCILVIVFVGLIQNYGQTKAGDACSYLDPIIIDILAFIAAVYLVIEGFFKLFIHYDSLLRYQFSRILRIMFGCAIITIHVLQVMHK